MNEIHIDSDLYTTRPESIGREEKEMRVYDLLQKLDIPYIRIDHEAAYTIDACHTVDEKLGIEICKNIFLCNNQKTKFFLLMLPGTKKFRTADLSKQIDSPRLSFAPPEYMKEFLNITPGSVSVLGLMNDINVNVTLLIDKEIINNEYVGCHPCVNTTSLKLKMADLLNKFLPATNHGYSLVDL
jgi:Ala-tRNA(Pro) deacylase